MFSWKNTKCREQQSQSILITTPEAGKESVNRFGLLPACSPTGENTVPRREDFTLPLLHPTFAHQKALQSASLSGSCFGQKLSKGESGSLHRGTVLLAMRWHLRKVLYAMKGSPDLPSSPKLYPLCSPFSLTCSLSLSLLLLSSLLSSSFQHHSSFLLHVVPCQTSCAPVSSPILPSQLSPQSLWAYHPQLAENAVLPRGPALPWISHQHGERKHETCLGKGGSSPFSFSCTTPRPDCRNLGSFTVAAERSAGVESFHIIYTTLYGPVYSEC